MITVLTALLNADNAIMEQILDYHGIFQLSIQNEDVYTSDGEAAPSENGAADEGSTDPDQPTTATSPDSEHLSRATGTPVSSSIETENESTEEHSEHMVSQRSHLTFGGPVPAPHLSADMCTSGQHGSNEDIHYRAILDQVVAAARRADIPSKGGFDMSSLRESLLEVEDPLTFDGSDGLEVGSRFRSSTRMERDRKIGAAGELYVSYFDSVHLGGH